MMRWRLLVDSWKRWKRWKQKQGREKRRRRKAEVEERKRRSEGRKLLVVVEDVAPGRDKK